MEGGVGRRDEWWEKQPESYSLRTRKDTLKNTHLLPIPDTRRAGRVPSAGNGSWLGWRRRRQRNHTDRTEEQEEKQTDKGGSKTNLEDRAILEWKR